MLRGPAFKRKQYFIQKTFQTKIIIRFVLILVLGSIITGMGLYFLAANELETRLYTAHMTITNTREILLPTIILTTVIVFILLALITIYTVLYLSHRIAGPLYKFEKITEEIGKGNLTVDVTLRKKDELTHLQNAFERMLESLQSKIGVLKKNCTKMKRMEYEINDAIKTSSLLEKNKDSLVKAVKELTKEYEDSINIFTTKNT